MLAYNFSLDTIVKIYSFLKFHNVPTHRVFQIFLNRIPQGSMFGLLLFIILRFLDTKIKKIEILIEQHSKSDQVRYRETISLLKACKYTNIYNFLKLLLILTNFKLLPYEISQV